MSERVFHPGLEGLRGVSVLAVLLFHMDPHWLPGGFLGVSTFFTLSGFLITGMLIWEFEQTNDIGLLNFWGRRLRRLLPASLLALLGIALLGNFLADPLQRERLSGDGLAALFYFSNWWLIVTGADYHNLMGSPSVIQHFWSLSIEEQYYFVYPILAYAVLRLTSGSRRTLGTILLTATAISWGWMFWLASSDVTTARLYYGADTRAGELLAGGILALVLASRTLSPSHMARPLAMGLGLLGLFITGCGWALARIDANGLYQGGFALYTLGTLAIIAAAIAPHGPARAILAWRPLRWLGRISYGAYVYHWPIFLWLGNDSLGLILTLALADISYRLLEEPIRSGRMIRGWQRLLVPLVAVGAIVLAFALPGATPERPKIEVPVEFANSPSAMNERPKIRVAVAGDSLARVIGEGLAVWAEPNGRVEIENIATLGCGISRGARLDAESRHEAACDRWPERVYPRLEAFQPDIVVVATANWDLVPRKLPEWNEPRLIGDPVFDRWMIQQYVEAFEFFRQFGAHVVWLTAPCTMPFHGVQTGLWDPVRPRRLNDYVLPAVAKGRESHLTILDLEKMLCPDRRFAYSLYGIEDIRGDGVHFSEAGKSWVGAWLGGALLESVVPALDATGRVR